MTHCLATVVSLTPLECPIFFRVRASAAGKSIVIEVFGVLLKIGPLTSSNSASKSVRSCVSQNAANSRIESDFGNFGFFIGFSIGYTAVSLSESYYARSRENPFRREIGSRRRRGIALLEFARVRNTRVLSRGLCSQNRCIAKANLFDFAGFHAVARNMIYAFD